MTTEQILSLVGAAAFGLVSKIIFDWLKNGRKKNNPNHKFEKLLERIATDIRWMKDAHAKVDQNGVPLWYVPRDWKKQLDKIVKNTSHNSEMLRRILRDEITDPGADD